MIFNVLAYLNKLIGICNAGTGSYTKTNVPKYKRQSAENIIETFASAINDAARETQEDQDVSIRSSSAKRAIENRAKNRPTGHHK